VPAADHGWRRGHDYHIADGLPLTPSIRATSAAPHQPGRLWTTGFRLLLVTTLLGWSAEGIVQTVLPLRILDLGGDAAAVGVVAAVFALPTLLLRPAIGRWIDRRGHGTLHQAGVLIAVFAPLGYLAGSIVLMPVNRFIQGIGWALYGTSNNVATARLAPPSRRGEASGYFNFTYALGFLVGPPLALYLYANADPAAPFVASSLFALLALVTVTALIRATPGAVIAREAADPAAADTTVAAGDGGAVRPVARSRMAALGSGIRGYLEPAAVPVLVVTALFMAGQGLLVGFAPVYARGVGAPLEWLAPFYPMYAILNATSQLVSGRLSDRVGRSRSVLLGGVLGSIGLLVAFAPLGFAGYAAGAACFAVAAGIVVPAAAAAAMDLAPAGRLGSQMATFSMAYQLAAGVGGLVWGLLIATVGYPWPFLVAVVLQAASVALAVRALPDATRAAVSRRPAE
jgi:MFS family permease